MAKKIKLSDAAKDLNIPSQELVDFFASKGDTKKKPSSSLSEDEMNAVLEHQTKLHEVKDLNAYFASKNDPKPEKKPEIKETPKPEKKTVVKDAPKSEKKAKTEKTSKADKPKDTQKKSVQEKKSEPKPVQEKKPEPKPVQEKKTE